MCDLSERVEVDWKMKQIAYGALVLYLQDLQIVYDTDIYYTYFAKRWKVYYGDSIASFTPAKIRRSKLERLKKTVENFLNKQGVGIFKVVNEESRMYVNAIEGPGMLGYHYDSDE